MAKISKLVKIWHMMTLVINKNKKYREDKGLDPKTFWFLKNHIFRERFWKREELQRDFLKTLFRQMRENKINNYGRITNYKIANNHLGLYIMG